MPVLCSIFSFNVFYTQCLVHLLFNIEFGLLIYIQIIYVPIISINLICFNNFDFLIDERVFGTSGGQNRVQVGFGSTRSGLKKINSNTIRTSNPTRSDLIYIRIGSGCKFGLNSDILVSGWLIFLILLLTI